MNTEYHREKYVVVEMANGDMMVGINPEYMDKQPIIMRNLKHNEFVPIVIYRQYGKIYKCPCCGSESGTLSPLHPDITHLFPHSQFPYCLNLDKIPVEQ
jgi:hypothetical protein